MIELCKLKNISIRFQSFQEEIVVWSNTYNTLRQLAKKLLQNNADFNLSQFQSQLYEINQRWNNLEQRYRAFFWISNIEIYTRYASVHLKVSFN